MMIVRCMLIWCFATSVLAGNETGNHDHSFTVDDETQILFEEAIYGEPFDPKSVDSGMPWSTIDSSLVHLKEKLPRTVDYLRSIFDTGRLLWYFVTDENVTLRDQDYDARDPRVVIAYNREQISLNDGQSVFIRKVLWDQLSPRGKSILLIHEMYWTAVGKEFIGSGKSIRDLSATTLNLKTVAVSLENLADKLQAFIGRKNKRSHLYQLIEHDRSYPEGQIGYKVSEIFGNQGGQVVVGVEHGEMKGAFLTKLNPNPNFGCTYFDDRSGYIFAVLGERNRKERFRFKLSDACENLNYGGRRNWRVPTEDEIFMLFNYNFNQLKYLPINADQDGQCLTNQSFRLMRDESYIFPRGIAVVSSDSKVIELTERYKDITSQFDDYVSYFCIIRPMEEGK